MVTFLIFTAAYLLTGFLCRKGIAYMRQHNLLRTRHTDTDSVYDLNKNTKPATDPEAGEISAIAALLAPIGVLMLIYHWIVIGWDKEERKLIRELKKDGANINPTHDQLRKAIKHQNDLRQKQLADELAEMERKAEVGL